MAVQITNEPEPTISFLRDVAADCAKTTMCEDPALHEVVIQSFMAGCYCAISAMQVAGPIGQRLLVNEVMQWAKEKEAEVSKCRSAH